MNFEEIVERIGYPKSNINRLYNWILKKYPDDVTNAYKRSRERWFGKPTALTVPRRIGDDIIAIKLSSKLKPLTGPGVLYCFLSTSYTYHNGELFQYMKIGMTERTFEERAKQYSGPTAIKRLVATAKVPNRKVAEDMLKEVMTQKFITRRREWFLIPQDQNIEVLKSMFAEAT